MRNLRKFSKFMHKYYWLYLPHDLLINVVAIPVFPHRPVRPILCTASTTKQIPYFLIICGHFLFLLQTDSFKKHREPSTGTCLVEKTNNLGVQFLIFWFCANAKHTLKGSFTLSESDFVLWSLSLFNVNIKLDILWTHLDATSLSLKYKRTINAKRWRYHNKP